MVAVYLLVFYITPLHGVSRILGKPFARFQVFSYLLIPDEILYSWLGNDGDGKIWDRFVPAAIAAAIILTAWAGGNALLAILGLAGRCGRTERSVIALAVGLNVLSTGILILGLFRLVDSAPPVAAILLGIWAFAVIVWIFRWEQHAGGRRIWDSIRECGIPHLLRTMRNPAPIAILTSASGDASPIKNTASASRDARRPTSVPGRQSKRLSATEPTLFGTAWLVWTGVFSCIILFQGVLPPIDFDVREYHLQAPKEFYWNGGIGFLPHNVYANMPLGVEMHALGAMAILGDFRTGALAGKTVIALFGPLLAASAYAISRRWGGRSHAVAAGLVIAATPWVIQVSTAGLNDIAFAVYVFLAFYAFTRAWEPTVHDGGADEAGEAAVRKIETPAGPDVPWLFLAGYLAGAAAACKYTGLVYSALPLAVLLFWKLRGNLNEGTAAAILVFTLAVGLGGGAWYAKNAVVCGNPFYPLLYPVFGGGAWNAEKNERWTKIHSAPDYALSSLAQDTARVTVSSDWLGPLVWPFALVGLIADTRRDERRKSLLLMTVWLLAVWWLLTHRIDRFWLPVLPFLAVAAADGLHAFPSSRVWKWSVYAAVILALMMTLLFSTAGICSYNRVLAPLKELWDDPGRIGETHLMINRMWPKAFSGKLLTVGEAAVFDFEMPVVYATCFDDQPWELLTKGRSPQEIHQALEREGIGCVFVNWTEIARYRSPGNYGFTDYVEPNQFHELVREGVLQPVLMPDRSPGQVYLVKPRRE